MLKPHEPYLALSFPESNISDKGDEGKPFSQAEQVNMCAQRQPVANGGFIPGECPVDESKAVRLSCLALISRCENEL